MTFPPQPEQGGYQPPQADDYQGFYAPQPPNYQPPQGWEQQPRRGRPPGPRGRTRTGCLGFLGLVVVIAIIVIISEALSGGSSKTAQPAAAAASNPAPAATTPPPSSPTTVTFSVTGSGNGGGAEINYGSDSDSVSPQNCTIGDLGDSCSVPWSASMPFSGSAEFYDINAQLGSEGGSITCTITVSGPGDQPLTVATGQASGPYQICDAQAAPTSSSGTSWQEES